jgi:hypothetical protein
MFDLLPLFPRNFEKCLVAFVFQIKEEHEQEQEGIFLPWSLDICNKRTSFSSYKTCWTMNLDNVGLKIDLLGTSSSMVTLNLNFFLM